MALNMFVYSIDAKNGQATSMAVNTAKILFTSFLSITFDSFDRILIDAEFDSEDSAIDTYCPTGERIDPWLIVESINDMIPIKAISISTKLHTLARNGMKIRVDIGPSSIPTTLI